MLGDGTEIAVRLDAFHDVGELPLRVTAAQAEIVGDAGVAVLTHEQFVEDGGQSDEVAYGAERLVQTVDVNVNGSAVRRKHLDTGRVEMIEQGLESGLGVVHVQRLAEHVLLAL